MGHVFVSHSSKNDAQVTRLHDDIKAAGFDMWVDHVDLAPGPNWQVAIDKALAAADALIVVLSPASVASQEVQAEWRDALLRGVPLLPVQIEDVPLLDIPSRLRLHTPVDLCRDWAGGIARIVEALRTHTGAAESTAAGAAAPRFVAFPVTGRIPRDLTQIPMAGRVDEPAAVLSLLEAGPVFLTGPGGRGKSRLAAEIALRGDGLDGAVWHRCDDSSRADRVVELLREHFDLDPAASESALRVRLRERRLLVVIDNAESVADPDARRTYVDCVEMLAAAGAYVVLTSRERWPEIDPATDHSPGDLTTLEAARIAAEMARVYGAKNATGHEAEIAEAARKHPRLIEWTIKQAKVLPLAEVLRQMRDFSGRRIEEALDGMIHSTLRQMTDRAGEAPAWALRRLRVTRGGFTYELANALCVTGDGPIRGSDDLLDALAALMTWGFLTRDAAERYRIDPLAEAAVAPADSAPALQRILYIYLLQRARNHHRRQDYFGFDAERDNLDSVLVWALTTDAKAGLWLKNATSNYFRNRGLFAESLNWSERIAAALAEHPDRMVWADAQNSLAIDLQSSPLGDRRANLMRAIACYEAALAHRTADAIPLSHAMTQNNLGSAYADLARIEDRAANLRKAIICFETALVHRTPDTAPLDHAMTQNNLGIAYTDLARIEDHAANLNKAIACYRAALIHYTPEDTPLSHAMTQNNLGAAYTDLAGIEHQAENLRSAIACYEAALVHYTPEAAPLDYAMTQNNLGNAYQNLASIEDHADNLRRAIVCYEAALMFYTPEIAPLDYAMTQNNLGAAYADLAKLEDQSPNLQRAIACYEAALVFRTLEADSLNHAMTQANLGIALAVAGEPSRAAACWRAAEGVYRDFGMEEDAEQVAAWAAEAEARLGGGSDSEFLSRQGSVFRGQPADR